MEELKEGIRINVQRNAKFQRKQFEPEDFAISITVPAKNVTKKLLDALMDLADQSLVTATGKHGFKLAINELPSEKVKEIEEYVKSQLGV